MGTAGGHTETPTYLARLVFPETRSDVNVPVSLTSVDLSGQSVQFEGAEAQPITMLLGRYLLRSCVLVWNGPAAVWSTFSRPEDVTEPFFFNVAVRWGRH